MLILVPPYAVRRALLDLSGVPANSIYVSGEGFTGILGNPVSSTYEGAAFEMFVPKTANGVRIILQAAGGSTSNNDGDAGSSGNSGATSEFILPPTFEGTLQILIGSAGAKFDGPSRPVQPRSISLVENPLGQPADNFGQGGWTGSGAYSSAIRVKETGATLAYAEGGGASVSYDHPYPQASRAYFNSAIAVSGRALNGPVSLGRGAQPGNENYPNWNFNLYPELATAYGKTASVNEQRFGKGGREVHAGQAGLDGFRGFLWMVIL